MPQLNPLPWFGILIASWLIFLLIVPQKVLAHKTPKKPTPQSTKKPATKPWNWPW